MVDEQQRQENISKLNEAIRDIPVAMLTTEAEDGSLHSRPMQVPEEAFDGQLWFFSKRDTAKTLDVKSHPAVNVSYCEPKEDRYVSVSGRAEVIEDKARADDLWQPRFRAWFPKGLDDPELVLIRVEVESAEYWDASASTLIRLAGFINAATRGKPYEGGEHEKMDIRH